MPAFCEPTALLSGSTEFEKSGDSFEFSGATIVEAATVENPFWASAVDPLAKFSLV
jgi:hypothetical protein